jgi:hypothetical protein
MYFNTFGGSALLHLLMGYPKLILVFGLAGTVAMTATPHGPGRYAGTSSYMAQLDAAIKPRLADAAAQREAQQRATDLLDRSNPEEIQAAVDDTLAQCGPGCTDLATSIVIDDPALLRRVLLLHELDQAATRARAAVHHSIATPPTAQE